MKFEVSPGAWTVDVVAELTYEREVEVSIAEVGTPSPSQPWEPLGDGWQRLSLPVLTTRTRPEEA